MFENVYMSNVAKREEKKAKNIIEMLFETFLRDPMKLPEDDRNMVEEMGVERVVCDYIAGMTDNYAIYQFNELFCSERLEHSVMYKMLYFLDNMLVR